jgi:hypothetical protein
VTLSRSTRLWVLALGLILSVSACTVSSSAGADSPGHLSAGSSTSTAPPASMTAAASCTTVTSDGSSLSLRLPAGWTKATDLGSSPESPTAQLAANLQLDRAADGSYTDLVSVYTSTHDGQVGPAQRSRDVAGVLQVQHDLLGREFLSADQLKGRSITVAGHPGLTGSFVDAQPNRAVRSSYHWWAFSADRVVFTVVLTEAQSGPSAAATVAAGISEKPCAS